MATLSVLQSRIYFWDLFPCLVHRWRKIDLASGKTVRFHTFCSAHKSCFVGYHTILLSGSLFLLSVGLKQYLHLFVPCSFPKNKHMKEWNIRYYMLKSFPCSMLSIVTYWEAQRQIQRECKRSSAGPPATSLQHPVWPGSRQGPRKFRFPWNWQNPRCLGTTHYLLGWAWGEIWEQKPGPPAGATGSSPDIFTT